MVLFGHIHIKIVEVPTEKIFRQFPMPMAKPLRTDTKIGTHIGSIICWLSWLWISSSVENIFINRCWLSVSLFKVLQIRFIWGSQNYRAGPQMPTTKNIERQVVSVGDPISRKNSTPAFTWDRIPSKTK